MAHFNLVQAEIMKNHDIHPVSSGKYLDLPCLVQSLLSWGFFVHSELFSVEQITPPFRMYLHFCQKKTHTHNKKPQT